MGGYNIKLSGILRHNAIKLGLKVASDGYIEVNELLKLKLLKGCTEEALREIVKTDKKTRFSLCENDGKLYIRANQGHSGDVAKCLDPEQYTQVITTPIEPCIHGTYSEFLPSIMSQGLSKMSRAYIHCAAGLPHEVKSGMRKDCDVFIYVDMKKAMADGIEFRMSANDVILTKGINGYLPPKYFEVKKKNIK